MFGLQAQFEDRRDAGQRLALEVARFARDDVLVLALPRGGVPVAFEVAASLHAPLDVVLVRKIGAPGQEELAVGAVVDGDHPHTVWNEDLLRLIRPPPDYLEAEERRQLAEIERRRTAYRGDRPSPEIDGRTVIVVDDGIATGATVRAALEALAEKAPKRLVLAVPVAPVDSLETLSAIADEVICLSTPEPFYAVGAHYRNFGQTSDEEVSRLLEQASRTAKG